MTTLTAQQAAARMGVKVQTIYAYVSRGFLEPHRAPDGRSSLFDERAVEALARRGRPRRATTESSIDLLIRTELTSIDPREGVRYRGHLAADLARTHTFEAVAELLWTDVLPPEHHVWPSGAEAASLSPGAPRRRGDPMGAIRVAAAEAISPVAMGDGPPDATAVAEVGRRLVPTLVASLPGPRRTRQVGLVLPARTRPVAGTVASRLTSRLCPNPTPAAVGLVNSALVLLADHELAASTLAVRVAASTWAHPAAAVCAGLGALQGPLHGAASRATAGLLTAAFERGAGAAVDGLLRTGQRVPGFGHRVYPGADPRATVLLELLARSGLDARAVAITRDVINTVAQRVDKHPNIDLPLALLGLVCGMDAGGGEAVMATARVAGWLAHAAEEYGQAPLRFRPRAAYVGRAKPRSNHTSKALTPVTASSAPKTQMKGSTSARASARPSP